MFCLSAGTNNASDEPSIWQIAPERKNIAIVLTIQLHNQLEVILVQRIVRVFPCHKQLTTLLQHCHRTHILAYISPHKNSNRGKTSNIAHFLTTLVKYRLLSLVNQDCSSEHFYLLKRGQLENDRYMQRQP